MRLGGALNLGNHVLSQKNVLRIVVSHGETHQGSTDTVVMKCHIVSVFTCVIVCYIKELVHSSIQVAVDLYGHLIPGIHRGAVDALAEATKCNLGATVSGRE